MKWRPGTDSGGAVLSFADNFHRADQPFMLGDNWLCSPVQSSTIVGGSNLAASINVAGNQANFSICSSNGLNSIVCSPIPVSWNAILTQPQFAQCRITADNSGGAIFAFNGPCVMLNVNKETGYWIKTNSSGVGNVVGDYIISSVNGGGAETVLAGPLTYVIGDTLRIEALPNTPSANNTTVNAYKNGLLGLTVVDNTNHYSFGVFGIFDRFVSSGITQSWDNFNGGVIGH